MNDEAFEEWFDGKAARQQQARIVQLEEAVTALLPFAKWIITNDYSAHPDGALSAIKQANVALSAAPTNPNVVDKARLEALETLRAAAIAEDKAVTELCGNTEATTLPGYGETCDANDELREALAALKEGG